MNRNARHKRGGGGNNRDGDVKPNPRSTTYNKNYSMGRGGASNNGGSVNRTSPTTGQVASDNQSEYPGIFADHRVTNCVSMTIGALVTVQTVSLKAYEGIFETMSPTGDVSILNARLISKDSREIMQPLLSDDQHILMEMNNDTRFIEKMVFNREDIICVNAPNVDLDKAPSGDHGPPVQSFATDGQIAAANGVGRGSGRALTVWVPDSDVADPGCGELLEQGASSRASWDPEDMFRRNTEMFGLRSTYTPDMAGYTTKLVVDRNSYTYKSAERLAKEIEEKKKDADVDEREEEDIYSAVVRPGQESSQNGGGAGMYVAPHRRGGNKGGPSQGGGAPMRHNNNAPPRFRQQQQERERAAAAAAATAGRKDRNTPTTNGEARGHSNSSENLQQAQKPERSSTQDVRGLSNKASSNEGLSQQQYYQNMPGASATSQTSAAPSAGPAGHMHARSTSDHHLMRGPSQEHLSRQQSADNQPQQNHHVRGHDRQDYGSRGSQEFNRSGEHMRGAQDHGRSQQYEHHTRSGQQSDHMRGHPDHQRAMNDHRHENMINRRESTGARERMPAHNRSQDYREQQQTAQSTRDSTNNHHHHHHGPPPSHHHHPSVGHHHRQGSAGEAPYDGMQAQRGPERNTPSPPKNSVPADEHHLHNRAKDTRGSEPLPQRPAKPGRPQQKDETLANFKKFSSDFNLPIDAADKKGNLPQQQQMAQNHHHQQHYNKQKSPPPAVRSSYDSSSPPQQQGQSTNTSSVVPRVGTQQRTSPPPASSTTNTAAVQPTDSAVTSSTSNKQPSSAAVASSSTPSSSTSAPPSATNSSSTTASTSTANTTVLSSSVNSTPPPLVSTPALEHSSTEDSDKKFKFNPNAKEFNPKFVPRNTPASMPRPQTPQTPQQQPPPPPQQQQQQQQQQAVAAASVHHVAAPMAAHLPAAGVMAGPQLGFPPVLLSGPQLAAARAPPHALKRTPIMAPGAAGQHPQMAGAPSIPVQHQFIMNPVHHHHHHPVATNAQQQPIYPYILPQFANSMMRMPQLQMVAGGEHGAPGAVQNVYLPAAPPTGAVTPHQAAQSLQQQQQQAQQQHQQQQQQQGNAPQSGTPTQQQQNISNHSQQQQATSAQSVVATPSASISQMVYTNQHMNHIAHHHHPHMPPPSGGAPHIAGPPPQSMTGHQYPAGTPLVVMQGAPLMQAQNPQQGVSVSQQQQSAHSGAPQQAVAATGPPHHMAGAGGPPMMGAVSGAHAGPAAALQAAAAAQQHPHHPHHPHHHPPPHSTLFIGHPGAIQMVHPPTQ